MMTISGYAVLAGMIHILAGLGLAVAPAVMREGVRRFSRHEWAGRILAAVALAWSAVLVREMPLGWFDAYKGWLWVVAPVGYVLVVVFMDELLAPRALGGLLLLSASPVLDAARWHPSTWRLALVIAAYGWVIAGMALVLGPYRFRQWAGVLCANDRRCRGVAAALLAPGGLFVWLGLTVLAG